MPPDLGKVERDGVGKENERQTEDRDDSQRCGVEREVENTKAVRAEGGSEREKDGDLRQAAAVDQSGKQRGHHDDEADDDQGGSEGFCVEGIHLVPGAGDRQVVSNGAGGFLCEKTG